MLRRWWMRLWYRRGPRCLGAAGVCAAITVRVGVRRRARRRCAAVAGGVVGEMVADGAADSPKIHARFEARDATSAISHAEYSVDAGPWQYLEPVGKVSDSLVERYDFVTPIHNVTIPVTDAKE